VVTSNQEQICGLARRLASKVTAFSYRVELSTKELEEMPALDKRIK
jgi:hypothetical protein